MFHQTSIQQLLSGVQALAMSADAAIAAPVLRAALHQLATGRLPPEPVPAADELAVEAVQRLRDLELRYSVGELSMKIGIHHVTLRTYMNGQRLPKGKLLARLLGGLSHFETAGPKPVTTPVEDNVSGIVSELLKHPEWTLSRIGKLFGISRERVRQWREFGAKLDDERLATLKAALAEARKAADNQSSIGGSGYAIVSGSHMTVREIITILSRDFTNAELSSVFDVPGGVVSAWSNGRRIPHARTSAAIGELYERFLDDPRAVTREIEAAHAARTKLVRTLMRMGLSTESIAARSGLGLSTVRAIGYGIANPSPNAIDKLEALIATVRAKGLN